VVVVVGDEVDDWRERTLGVVAEVIEPAATEIDQLGQFPAAGVERLAKERLLGVLSAREVGGSGLGLGVAAEIVRLIAAVCPSTAMVATMHLAAVSVIEALGPEKVRSDIAAGRHLSTLAFSETGSRSEFWVPLSTATAMADSVVLDAEKSWVTSATRADSYVWSSRPMAGEGPMTLWLVPSQAPGLEAGDRFDGLGLRGNDSRPVRAAGVVLPASSRLGADGAGLDVAMGYALPAFLVLSTAACVGIMEAAVAAASAHLVGTRLVHVDATLAEQKSARVLLARLKVSVDLAHSLLQRALALLEAGDPGALPVVLEAKAAAAEAAAEVTDGALRLGGGQALRRPNTLERMFRDARAARVMAPTSDTLFDFVGRLLVGMPLLDGPA
jgi:isovaleryl-CoA dehydrogenase